jgi:hypothetical protein
MSPLANLLTRGKEETNEASLDVSDLTASRVDVVAKVNLLPPEIAEGARFRREQVVRGLVVAATLGAVVVVTMSAMQSASDAEQAVAAEQARSTQLASQVRALAVVPATAELLAAAQAQRVGALGNEVRWSQYLNDVSLITPEGIQLKTMGVEQSVDTAAGAPGAVVSATGQPGLATVTYAGSAASNRSLALMLESLAGQKGNIDPYFTSAEATVDGASKRDVVEFALTTTVTDEAKSNRYTNEGE